MRRRDFITLVGGAAAAWPLAARAQQREQMRRIGVFMPQPADDPEQQARVARFLQGLQELGWTVGRNVQIDWRWRNPFDADHNRTMASELAALSPDVLLSSGIGISSLRQVTSTIPIVFAGLNDPVGNGTVASLAHPGGNVTGFAGFEYGFSAKWLQLLKQIAPNVTRVAVVRDLAVVGGTGQLGALQGAAFILGTELTIVDPANVGEMERGIVDFARRPNGGIIVPNTAVATARRGQLIALAAQHRLPAVYNQRRFVVEGGLISYGVDVNDMSWRAAGYVDRILKGEKPADLPVQAPTKYETAINLKTAKVLGLTVPPSLLASADEVIE
jgi:putative ABC transport system substrate-binding protein